MRMMRLPQRIKYQNQIECSIAHTYRQCDSPSVLLSLSNCSSFTKHTFRVPVVMFVRGAHFRVGACTRGSASPQSALLCRHCSHRLTRFVKYEYTFAQVVMISSAHILE